MALTSLADAVGRDRHLRSLFDPNYVAPGTGPEGMFHPGSDEDFAAWLGEFDGLAE